ncbi:hypothetical protein ABW21_db0205975 [Orbilia brochopaga]|nr:hypothetical protein ABW21_db0205975 [Drechslerella brochopaga]
MDPLRARIERPDMEYPPIYRDTLHKASSGLPLFDKIQNFRYRFTSVDKFQELADDVEEYRAMVEDHNRGTDPKAAGSEDRQGI